MDPIQEAKVREGASAIVNAKMPAKASLVARLGFTPARRRALLGLIGLEKADHAPAAWLQKNVIAPHIDEMVDEFYRRLWKNPQARNILGQGFELAYLRAMQRTYLLTLGIGFDRAAYFEGRLRVGVVHARVPVPLSLYQAAYALLQCLILAHLSAARHSAQGVRLSRRGVPGHEKHHPFLTCAAKSCENHPYDSALSHKYLHCLLIDQGLVAGLSRVKRLRMLHGIRCTHKKKLRVTIDSQHNLPVAPHFLEWDEYINESRKKLLGKRIDGEFLWHAQNGKLASLPLYHPRASQAGGH